ncbi:RidA family protein [Nocardia jiangxiensis]|uniref:RidA family protein n=1 Tax=Nocardia jiangxiensis TaxID=282685 RepID=A0ABW6SCC1_9NOCA|nr:RidA family protein [Nocardia jiangxiensis]
MSAIERVSEIYPQVPERAAAWGLQADRLVVGLGIAATPGEDDVGDLEHQARSTLRRMQALVEASGGSLDNVAKATAYVTREKHREPVNGQWWQELFPDPGSRPAYKVLLADLPPGRLVELDVTAVLGATRRRIDLPGVPARDPTVEIGGMVFTSRVHPTLPFAEGAVAAGGLRAQARQAFENVLALLEQAGGTATDIVQLISFGRTRDHIEPTREALAEMFPDEATRPRLETLVNFIPAKFEVMVEMAAAIGGQQ